jgi:hypothetical protein
MPFKTCPSCSHLWESRDDFLISPDIRLLSYQPAFKDPEKGLFLFNHANKKCGTTLAVPVACFIDMYHGIIYTEIRTGLIDCKGHCLRINDFDKCFAPCSMAYVREIMRTILNLNSNKIVTAKIE